MELPKLLLKRVSETLSKEQRSTKRAMTGTFLTTIYTKSSIGKTAKHSFKKKCLKYS